MADALTIAPKGTPLTPAERRALQARYWTDTDAEAAAVLGISVHTLRAQLANARSRLGVARTERAIRVAGQPSTA